MLLNGEGKQVTATSTTAIWTPSKSGANSLSVDVEEDIDVYCLVNCTTAEFDTLHAAGKSIKVRFGIPFVFYGDQYTNLKSICFRTATTDCDINLAAY